MRTQYSISRSISGAQDHWPFRGSEPLAEGGNRPVRGRLVETRPHPPYYPDVHDSVTEGLKTIGCRQQTCPGKIGRDQATPSILLRRT